MATQPIAPPSVPPLPGAKPMAPPAVPSALGAAKAGGPPPVPGAIPAPGQKPNLKLPAGAPGSAENPQEAGEEEGLHPTIGFWQQPWVQNILPFVTSLAVHASILIIGLLAFGVYKVVNAPPHQEQTIIPDSNMVENGPPGGVPNVGVGGDPLRQAMQDKDPTASDPKGWADKKGPSVDISQQGGGSGDSSDAVIGVGPGGGFGKGGGLGSGKGDGRGGGAGDGGPLAMFGTPGGGGIGPKGPVFGNGGNARMIAFVCDASGSMINKMAQLKNQLNKAVMALKPIQSFSIIFFQDAKYDALPKEATLIAATPENKRKAGTFLDGVTTTGTTDPIPGIKLAFAQHPQLIYLLTDGDFPDNAAVLKTIRDLNKGAVKVKINTIAFVGSGDNEVAFLELLKTIAQENGGVFKHVNEGDL